jgi:mRNA-degrading endonuclease toxin of MazEF toxin-antitoxin module
VATSSSSIIPLAIALDRRYDYTIVVVITSRTRFVAAEPTQLLIAVSTPDGKQTGLLFDSAVQCENILTIDGQFIIRKIGVFSPHLMNQIRTCLQASLEIA